MLLWDKIKDYLERKQKVNIARKAEEEKLRQEILVDYRDEIKSKLKYKIIEKEVNKLQTPSFGEKLQKIAKGFNTTKIMDANKMGGLQNKTQTTGLNYNKVDVLKENANTGYFGGGINKMLGKKK